MPRTFSHCDKIGSDVRKVVEHIIKSHFPDLEEAKLKVDLVFAEFKDGIPVLSRGLKSDASIRKTLLKERCLGGGDVEVVIDLESWKVLSQNRRDAVVHRELFKIIVDREGETNEIRKDAIGRPFIKLKPYDVEFRGFRDLARIYGRDSIEVTQAESIMAADGQLFWPGVAPDATGHTKLPLGGQQEDGE